MKRRLIYIFHKTNFMIIIKYLFWFYDCIIKLFVPKPKRIDSIKKVMLLCSFGVGDGILFLSTIKKYRKKFPKSKYEITVVCSSKTKVLFEKETDFDKFIEFNIDSVISNFKGRYRLYKIINKEYYDYFIDILGPNQFAMNVYTTHASFADKKIAIVNKDDTSCPINIINKTYNELYYVDKKNIHIVECFNQLIDNLLNEKSNILFHKTNEYSLDIKLPKTYYMVFPSANSGDKKWPAERYADIINKVYDKTHLTVVFTGTKSDKKTIDTVISLLDKKTKYYNIETSIDVMQFIQTIKNAKFIITNDSGPYHIAISENIPVAGIMGGYTYCKYAYYNFNFPKNWKKPYLITENNKCFNCKEKCNRIGFNDVVWPCLNDIKVDDAWKIINEMINDYSKK